MDFTDEKDYIMRIIKEMVGIRKIVKEINL